jgi:hypothetical protein
MTIPIKRIQELFHLMQEVDLPTLRALEQKLHVLLRQKEAEQPQTARNQNARVEFRRRHPHIPIELALFNLVGIQPESPLEDDKKLIREQIFRRLAE